jgi:hypothetical protein
VAAGAIVLGGNESVLLGGFLAIAAGVAVGGIAFGFALALGSLAWWLAPVLGEPDDGNDAPRPTAPPAGTAGTAIFPDTAAA